MIYQYNVKVPLYYNRYDISNNNPNLEIQYELDNKEITTDYKISIKTYDLPGFKEIGYEFSDLVRIKLYSIDNSQDSLKNGFDRIELYCEIKGILVDDEVFARKYTETIIDKICKRLSVLFIKQNANRHLFQPRVDALWSKANIIIEEYKPYVDVKRKLSESINGNTKIIKVEERMCIRESVSILQKMVLPEKEINLSEWLSLKSETTEFLLNEYYAALGTENIKSKFFHLFAIIEFTEQKYEEYNGSTRLFTDDEVKNIKVIIGENTPNQLDKDKKSCILSLVTNALIKANDTGRSGKLLNILKRMGIERYNRFEKNSIIEKNELEKIINLRNKSFHGTKEKKEEVTKKYADAVVKLFYVDEQILDFVMRDEDSQNITNI